MGWSRSRSCSSRSAPTSGATSHRALRSSASSAASSASSGERRPPLGGAVDHTAIRRRLAARPGLGRRAESLCRSRARRGLAGRRRDRLVRGRAGQHGLRDPQGPLALRGEREMPPPGVEPGSAGAGGGEGKPTDAVGGWLSVMRSCKSRPWLGRLAGTHDLGLNRSRFVALHADPS
jgi:hypothetical protein